MKIVHPSVDYDREATDSDEDENNDENACKTPYDGENMNAYSDDKGNNDEDSPEKSYDGENMNAFSNNEGNNYEVAHDPPTNDDIINTNSDDITPDIPTNGGNNGTIDNGKKEKEKLRRKQITKT